MSDRVKPQAIDATGYSGGGTKALHDDGTWKVPAGGSTDPEVVRDTIAAALVAGTGMTITTDDAANTITLASSGGGGGSLSVQDENGTAITGVTQLDFQGAGVTAAAGTGEVVVTIPGGGASSDSGWQLVGAVGQPAFANSWVNFGAGEQVASFRKVNGIVYLNGIIKSGVVGLDAFVLPVGYRPSMAGASTNALILPAVSNSAFGRVSVAPTGGVSPQAPSSNAWVSLTGIAFIAA